MSHGSGRRAVDGWDSLICTSVVKKVTTYNYNFINLYCTVKVMKLKILPIYCNLMGNFIVSNDINKKGKFEKLIL